MHQEKQKHLGSDCMRLNAQTLNKTKLTWVSIARDFVETKIECICDWITAFEKQTRELKLSINALLYRRLYYPSARGWPSRNLSACKGERICCFCACTPLFLSKNPGGKQVQDFFFLLKSAHFLAFAIWNTKIWNNRLPAWLGLDKFFGNSIYEHVWEQQEQKQEQKHRKSRSKVTIFMVWGGGGFLTMWGGWVFLLRYPLYYTIRNTQYITHNTLPYTYLLNLHRYLQQVLNPYGYLTYELNSFRTVCPSDTVIDVL